MTLFFMRWFTFISICLGVSFAQGSSVQSNCAIPPQNIWVIGASLSQGWGGPFASPNPLQYIGIGLGNRSPGHQVFDQFQQKLGSEIKLTERALLRATTEYHYNAWLKTTLPRQPRYYHTIDYIFALDFFQFEFREMPIFDEYQASIQQPELLPKIRATKMRMLDILDRFSRHAKITYLGLPMAIRFEKVGREYVEGYPGPMQARRWLEHLVQLPQYRNIRLFDIKTPVMSLATKGKWEYFLRGQREWVGKEAISGDGWHPSFYGNSKIADQLIEDILNSHPCWENDLLQFIH